MSWKNGGGTTTEIARSPESSSLDDFDWRISIARVAASGPFSRFARVDRSMAILEGEGIVLTIDGRESARLDTCSTPFAFRGDADVSGMLVGGPIEDLNVMTRRGRFRQVLRRLDWTGLESATFALTSEVAFFVVGRGAASLRHSGSTYALGARETLRIDGSGVLDLSHGEGTDVLCVELWRA
jgi:uncharacterized protein